VFVHMFEVYRNIKASNDFSGVHFTTCRTSDT
jgi:hypothetical protein